MTAYILLMIMGLGLCLFIFSIKSKYRQLVRKGEKTDGILQGYETVKIRNNTVKVPVVSFVTRAGQSFVLKDEKSFFPANAKKGSRMYVFYDPVNPEAFMIQGKKFNQMCIVVLAGGIVFILTGLILLLNYLDIIHWFKK